MQPRLVPKILERGEKRGSACRCRGFVRLFDGIRGARRRIDFERHRVGRSDVERPVCVFRKA